MCGSARQVKSDAGSNPSVSEGDELNAGSAERFTYRLHPAPPRVPRGISRNSPSLDGLGLYPSRQKKPSPTWHGRPARGGIMGKMPMPRQPRHGGVSFSPYSLRLCVNLLFPSCLLRLGRVSARDRGVTAGMIREAAASSKRRADPGPSPVLLPHNQTRSECHPRLYPRRRSNQYYSSSARSANPPR